MSNIIWVTSFSKKYYDTIGYKTLDSWKFINDDKVFLCELDPGYVDTEIAKIDIRESLQQFEPELQKSISRQQRKAYKFFKKAYCIWYALCNFSGDYDFVLWVDTDSVIKKTVDTQRLLPDPDQLFATTIRGVNACDSGFIAFNTNHSRFETFRDEYISFYTQGKIWQMTNPWDAYILEDIAKRESIRNLYFGNPMDNSCGLENTYVEEYINHFWGKKRKIENLRHE